MTGPNLVGVEERWEDKDKLYQWIKNSNSLIEEGDPYAVYLFEEWNKIIMPNQPVTDEDIDQILMYLREWTQPISVY